MKILYDHQMFSTQKYGGITRYFCELIKNFPSEHQFTLPLIFSDNHYLKENPGLFKIIDILPTKKFKGKNFIKKRLYSINQYYSKYHISKNNFDLFHPTYYNNYFISVLKKPYIITVHDLIPFKFRETYFKHDFKFTQMEYVIKNASRIISISDNTKKDLMEILKINANNIDVIYHGFRKSGIQYKKENIGKKYILFVGLRNAYKNFKTFAEAVSKLFERERDLNLICVGEDLTYDEMAYLSKLRILDKTIVMNADENKLNDLYSNALMFVYPSLYEGFGMPILEAFANNCPLCLSNTSCFPEIAGNAGSYFNPESHESILLAIEKVLYDKDFAQEIIKAGQNRLKDFSWSKTILETLNSYTKAI